MFRDGRSPVSEDGHFYDPRERPRLPRQAVDVPPRGDAADAANGGDQGENGVGGMAQKHQRRWMATEAGRSDDGARDNQATEARRTRR